MILRSTFIKNFRSIEEATIDFVPSCRVLVGINESGKSNVLKALRLLDPGVSFDNADIRQPLPSEGSISESCIRFTFALEESEIEEVYKNILPKVLIKDNSRSVLKTESQELNLKDTCHLKDDGIYKIDIKDQKRTPTHSMLSEEYAIFGNWKKPKEGTTFTVQPQNGDNQNISSFLLINTDDYQEIPTEELEDIDTAYLNRIIGDEIVKIIYQKLPPVIFWEYNEDNLLPPSVVIETFTTNPDSCVPLKNMFLLAGISNISEEINKERQTSPNAFRNLLRRVAKHTTTHFRNVWKEYKDIKFSLEPNGENIDCGIEEENIYNFSQRSDGFKRFVSFLLMISVKAKKALLENTLLLVDEADSSLHPTGARYLREELIKISENNYVIYSTHSIFMIDRNNIGRHYIVEKSKEKTYLVSVDESNITDEEVIYNAIGASIFESLKPHNILFEGWKDKHLFQVAINTVPSSYRGMKKIFKDIGYCHAHGAKSIKNVTPMLELGQRECFILTDADDPAKQHQTEYEQNHGYGVWKRYDQINTTDVVTSEDFIKGTVVVKALKEELKKYPSIQINTDPQIQNTSGKLNVITAWLKQNSVSDSDCKLIIDQTKNNIFTNLKAVDIENLYYEFLKALGEEIKRIWQI